MRIGDRLLEKIAGAIEQMDFLLAVISNASVDSPWCKHELALAMHGELREAQVKVLPIRLGPVEIPASLADVNTPILAGSDPAAIADRVYADMSSHRAERTRSR